MIIHSKDILDYKNIIVSGDEPWLARIYETFPAPSSAAAPRLSASLNLRKLSDDLSIEVTGDINYAPFVECGICGEPRQWSLSMPVHARFTEQPAFLATKKNYQLKAEELDDYYFAPGHSVDLEVLLNDSIHSELPTYIRCEDLDQQPCQSPVHDPAPETGTSETQPSRQNPFAALAALKLNDQQES